MKKLATILLAAVDQVAQLAAAWRRARPVAETRRGACPSLPGARYEPPAAWTETDKENLDAFLRTPSGRKLLLTLHDLTVSRALSVVDRPAYDHGITGGMSVMLGEIERLACEGEPEEPGKA